MTPSLTNRLRIGSAVLVALLVTVSILGVGRLFQVRQQFEDRSARFFELGLENERIRSAFVLQQAALTRDRAAVGARRRSFDAAVGEGNTALSNARRLAEGQPQVVDSLDRRAAAEADWRREVAEPVLAGKAPVAGTGRQRTRAVLAAGDELVQTGHDARTSSRETALDETRDVLYLVVAGLAGALLAAIVLFATLLRSMRAPLARLVDGARQLAGGRLDTRVEVGGPSEISTLGGAFNEMASALERDARERDRMEQMKDDFLLTVSHELRTPVTSVKGFAEMLAAQENTLSARQREAIEAITDSAGDLSTLIDDLLDLARSDAGRLRLEQRPTEVRQLLDRVARGLRPGFESRNQKLEVSSEEGLPPIEADPERVAQALSNLLTNSNKYAPEGASVRLTAQRNGGGVVIEVADDGPGIPQTEVEHVFERFWRGDSSERQRVGGTGLGLAITKSLVELHGGVISVSSQPGAGITFRIELPER